MVEMHPLIEVATKTIRTWTTDEPRELSLAVAALCRGVLDQGSLPKGGHDWQRLRAAFEISRGTPIADTIVSWDTLCRHGDFDITEHDAIVKLGIVTWTVKLLLKQVGMLSDEPNVTSFSQWQSHLCNCLEKYIVVRPRDA